MTLAKPFPSSATQAASEDAAPPHVEPVPSNTASCGREAVMQRVDTPALPSSHHC